MLIMKILYSDKMAKGNYQIKQLDLKKATAAAKLKNK